VYAKFSGEYLLANQMKPSFILEGVHQKISRSNISASDVGGKVRN